MSRKLSKRLVDNFISRRAKVQSDKPAYKEKEKSDSGNIIYRYDEKHISKRWEEKKEKLKKLEKGLKKVRDQYQKDLTSDDERTRAIAAIVGIMDGTAMRIGNEDSAKEGTYGASTLKVKHVKGGSGKMTFDFPGKGAVEQNVVLENNKVIKVIRDLMKGKKKDDFIFEVDGKKIWDRAVNRYLSPFDISAKDLRGFHANRLMKEMLKKKDWKEALEEVAEIVGHKASTLKNQYLDPELLEKHEGKEKKASISIRADDQVTPDIGKIIKDVVSPPEYGPGAQTKQTDPYANLKQPQQDSDSEQGPMIVPPEMMSMLYNNVNNIAGDISNYPDLQKAWRIIAPFLPEGARLTNGWRGDNDQARIILDYWLSATWPDKSSGEKWSKGKGFFVTNFPEMANTRALWWWRNLVKSEKPVAGRRYDQLKRDIEPLRQIMTRYRPKGLENEPPTALSIAPLGTSKHLTGEALDISGVPLSSVVRAADYINSNISPVFVRVLPEKGQQAVHLVVNENIQVPSDEALALALADYHGVTNKKASISKRAELSPEDIQWVERELKAPIGRTTPGGAVAPDQKTRKQYRIRPKVKLNPLLFDAWRTLQPFLPRGAVMTSGFRTPEDQRRILNYYWKKATGSPIPAHLLYNKKALVQISRLLKKHHGYDVGPPVKPKNPRPFGHFKGNCIDVSGADLDEISRAVNAVSDNPQLPVKFKKPFKEQGNNCVHIRVVSAEYDEEAITQVLETVRRTASISKHAEDEQYDVDEFLEDFMSSDPPAELVEKLNPSLESKAFYDEDGAYGEGIDDDPDDLELEMGFGLPDERGDWFEKSPIFRWREDIPEFDIHDLKESEAKKMAEDDPEKFFYRGLHKEYPDLESTALKNMIETNPKFYFIFKYYERDEEEFLDIKHSAAELLSEKDPRAFFYYELHHEWPELGRGAVLHLIDKDPRSFGQLGLDKDYPDLKESATNAINIYDPTKVDIGNSDE